MIGFLGGSGGGDDWLDLLDGFSGNLGGRSFVECGSWDDVLVGNGKLLPVVSYVNSFGSLSRLYRLGDDSNCGMDPYL